MAHSKTTILVYYFIQYKRLLHKVARMLTVRSLRTLSTASSLAQMKTSRGRSSRAELCSSFKTYGKMPTDSAYRANTWQGRVPEASVTWQTSIIHTTDNATFLPVRSQYVSDVSWSASGKAGIWSQQFCTSQPWEPQKSQLEGRVRHGKPWVWLCLPLSKRTAGNPDKLWNISIVVETVVDDVSMRSC